MPLDALITTTRLGKDPIAREFIEYLRANAAQLRLDNAILYYDFPTYSDYETSTHKPDALVISPDHGIITVRFVDGKKERKIDAAIAQVDESIGQFCSTLIGRLLKSRPLRKGLSQLTFTVTPIIFVSTLDPAAAPQIENSKLVFSLGGFQEELRGLIAPQKISDGAIAEIRSVVEGAKALTRPQRRTIEDTKSQKLAVALADLEAEIANFDQVQRRAALVTIDGPQRLRGLAGSGKTVILAMKAAHLHLTQPDQKILITFFTRSLRSTIQTLIAKFCRHYREEEPDWNLIHIRHGWGGANARGAYSDACQRAGISPLTFGAAQQAGSKRGILPFDAACRHLLENSRVDEYYDHILIDEGQDFPSSFYEMCFHLAKGSRDKKNIVWAYDELQNILDVKIRSAEDLFGFDQDGAPRISLERAARELPAGGTNDTVLSKCYRNQGEVLVTAHALGFGIYGEIVQLLEGEAHWRDVGYEVEPPATFKVNEKIRIKRPPENSPTRLSEENAGNLIETAVFGSMDEETTWVCQKALGFLKGGLNPEDILCIALDDRNARAYFQMLSGKFAESSVETNNIIADPYNEPPFSIAGKVTLSTVYRAKGNEGAVVFAMGVDAVAIGQRSGRNKLFTACTRTKGWLRVSGMGNVAHAVCKEIGEAQKNFPYLTFKMPDLAKIETIQRDLSERAIRVKKLVDEYAAKLKKEGLGPDEVVEALSRVIKNG